MELVNSRPCCSCIEIARVCGIKNIFYTDDKGMFIRERTNNIISIHSSAASKTINSRYYNFPDNNFEYYKKLLIYNLPKEVKNKNLMLFLLYCEKYMKKYFIFKIKNNKINFYDKKNNFIVSSIIY